MGKVLVTGSSGFLGSHTADELTKRGYEVILFDKIASPYKSDNQKEIIGDLQNLEFLTELLSDDIDYVYHFAGIADIGVCAENPIPVIYNNILSTVNLLEASRLNNIKRFFFASTAYVFSSHGSFYRSSKRACESFIQDYFTRYGLDYTIFRYGSLYGSRTNMRNGVYRLIKNLLEAKEEYVHIGSSDEYREFINVVDASKLAVDVLEKEYDHKIFMITGMERYKISELIQMIQEMIGKYVPVKYTNTLEGHYKITPYNYVVEESVKLICNPFCDMGQGVLELIRDISDGK